MWNTLSDEKTGLQFFFSGHRQHSIFQFWVPQDSWAYFIISISETPPSWKAKILYLLPPGTGKPSYNLGLWSIFSSQVKSSYIPTDSQSASLSWCQAPILEPRQIFPSSLFNYFEKVTDLMMWDASLTRSRVCSFQLSIFYGFYFWDSPNMEGHVPVFISPQGQGSPVIPTGIGFSLKPVGICSWDVMRFLWGAN
jgi:hypothetical protein